MMPNKKFIKLSQDPSQYTIPVSDGELPPFLKKVYETLTARVIGQNRPIKRAMRFVSNFYARLNNPKRPPGILMVAGPSGVGKTHFARTLGEALIGEPEDGLDPIVFVDCGSLSLEHTVASLTGAPPGYKGYGDMVDLEQIGFFDRKKKGLDRIDEMIERRLAEFNQYALSGSMPPDAVSLINEYLEAINSVVEKNFGPFRSVVIFDEIEKADLNIQRQLLGILEEGKLRLLNGRVVDFSGAFIIFTTNVGTQQILDEYLSQKTIGFPLPKKEQIQKANDLNQQIWRSVRKEIWDNRKGHFLPEFLGRIGKDGIIVFHSLSLEDYQKILELQLQEIQGMLSGKEDLGPGPLLLNYTQSLKTFLIEEAVSPEYGARALRSVLEKYIKEPIAHRILTKKLKVGDKIILDVEFIERNGGKPAQSEALGWARQNEELLAGREAQIVVFRQRRPKNIKLPDFEVRMDWGLTPKIEQSIQDGFDRIFKRFYLYRALHPPVDKNSAKGEQLRDVLPEEKQD